MMACAHTLRMTFARASAARVRRYVLSTPGNTLSRKFAVAPSRPLLDTLRSRLPTRDCAGCSSRPRDASCTSANAPALITGQPR